MQIINAVTGSKTDTNEHSCSDHSSQSVENPAAHFGDFQHSYQKEFGYQAIDKDAVPAEVPEIRVNGVLIEENSVLAEVQHHPAQTKRKAMIKAAETLIIGELLRQQAIELGLLSDSAEPNSVEEAAGLKVLIEQQVSLPEASDTEQQRFYQANKDKFTTSPLLEVKHILLAAAPDDVSERIKQKEIAEQLIAQIKQTPSSFDQLVALHSHCPSKQENGNLGQITKGQTVVEFEQALFKANEGLIDYPIESRYGYHIAYVHRKVDGQVLPYEAVKDKVSEYLKEKVSRKATAHYIQSLIEQADISGFNFDIEQGLMQ